jgi:mono/diheme cytochrome c family protein
VDVNVGALISAVVLIGLLGAILWYATQVAQPTPETAAGPPTGALAMERKIIATVAMIAAMALLFLGYGLKEEDRQAMAQEVQLDISIGRGITNYTTLCFGCHGEMGQGAVVPDSDPMRLAPPLNRADLRPQDADERKRRFDFIFKTIQRGRPGTPMPAWGQTDGGTLLDEHINELALMILNGDRPVGYEGHRGTPWEHTAEVVKEHVAEGLVQMPRQPEVEQLPFYQALGDQEKTGVRVALQKGCGSAT